MKKLVSVVCAIATVLFLMGCSAGQDAQGNEITYGQHILDALLDYAE